MFEISDSINILNAVSANDVEHLGTILKTIRHGMYHDYAAQTIITCINKQLSVGHTRDKGFELLHYILPDCSTKVLQENCVSWTNYTLSHHPKEPVSRRRLQVLCTILDLCHGYQDYHKLIVLKILPKIMETCLSVHRKSKEAWFSLDCLIKCLKYFPTTCIVYKKKIEHYLLILIDSEVTYSIVEQAGICMHYLNQVGGSGSLGSTHIKNYHDNLNKLFNTLDKLYDKLFENTNEFCERNSDHGNVYEFTEIPSSLGEIEKLRVLERRLKNVTTFILKSIECDYPVKKSMQPELILSVIQRGLAVHVHINDKNLSNILLSTVIHNHQLELLNLMKTCITCLKETFIRFSTIKIVQDYLVRMQNCSCFRSSSEYKVVVYQILEYWILNTSEFLDSAMYDKIIKHIVSDIKPAKYSLLLNVDNVKQKKAVDKQMDNIIPPRLQQISEDICYQALVTLHVLLQKVLLTIRDSSCSVLFEVIFKNLFDISVNIYRNPYISKNNRLMLYKVLIAIFDQQGRNKRMISVEIALAINLLHIGQLSSDVDISNICSVGLAALEKICQPTHRSLSLNILDDATNNKSQKFGARDFNHDVIDDIHLTMETNETQEINFEVQANSTDTINGTEEITVNHNKEELSIKTNDIVGKIDEKITKSRDIDVGKLEEISGSKPIDNNSENVIDVNKRKFEAELDSTSSKINMKETKESNVITLDEEEKCTTETDLQLENSSHTELIIEKDEVPAKKRKTNESEEDIDVVGDDLEDMLSSFVDEINE